MTTYVVSSAGAKLQITLITEIICLHFITFVTWPKLNLSCLL